MTRDESNVGEQPLPEQSNSQGGMTGNEAVEHICEEFRRQGVDPLTARNLQFVTWEEIIRTVVTAAGQAGVFEIRWPEEASNG